MEDQQIPSAEYNSLDNFFNIALDAPIRAQIKVAATWAKIAAICVFVGYAFVLATTIAGPIIISKRMGSDFGSQYYQTTYIIVIVLLVAIASIVNYFLYRFAAATARGMDSMDNVSTNQGFNSLRIYFRILGIFTIISLSFVVLGILYVITRAAV
jgi:hypothetical protein